MSTSASASAIVPLPIDAVWASLRKFDFPLHLIDSVDALDVANQTEVGAVRSVTWKSGEQQQHQLIELNDQEYTLAYELVGLNHDSEVDAALTRVSCKRITEENSTLIIWSAEYSSDVSGQFITWQQTSFQHLLNEIRGTLMREHLKETEHEEELAVKKVIMTLYTAEGGWDEIAGLFTSQATVEGVTGVSTVQEYMEVQATLHASFPDYAIELLDVLCDDDKVVVLVSAQGTFSGADYNGTGATNQSYAGKYVYIFSFFDGKIEKVFKAQNELDFQKQVGISA